jgi:hypothetical protein
MNMKFSLCLQTHIQQQCAEVTLQTYEYVRDVLGSNLGEISDILTKIDVFFSFASPGKFHDNISTRPRPLPSKSFPSNDL